MSEESLSAYGELLEALSRLRRLRPGTELMPEGITPGEMGTLAMIGHAQRAGHDIRPGFIAAHTHTSKGAVSQSLKALEEKGLIVRERSAADARAVRILLTEAGETLFAQANEMRRSQMEALVDYLGADDLAQLTRIVRKVVDYQESHGSYLEAEVHCKAERKEGETPCV